MRIVLCLGEFYTLMSFVGTVLEGSEHSSSFFLFYERFWIWKSYWKNLWKKTVTHVFSGKAICRGLRWYSSSDYLLSIYQVSIARSNRWYWWKGYWGDYRPKLFKCKIFNNLCCAHIHDPTFLLLFRVLGNFLKYFMTSSVGN